MNKQCGPSGPSAVGVFQNDKELDADHHAFERISVVVHLIVIWWTAAPCQYPWIALWLLGIKEGRPIEWEGPINTRIGQTVFDPLEYAAALHIARDWTYRNAPIRLRAISQIFNMEKIFFDERYQPSGQIDAQWALHRIGQQT